MLIRGRWVITSAEEPVLNDGALLVEEGRIAARGTWSDLRAQFPEATAIGSDRMAVIPGLINAHHHSGAVTALQQGLPDMLLEPWILAHARLRPVDPYLNCLLSAGQLLRSGVTSVVEVQSGRGKTQAYASRVEDSLKAYAEAGIRVAFAPGVGDQSHLVHGKDQDAAFVAALPSDLQPLAESLLPASGDIDQSDYLGVIDDFWNRYRDHPTIDIWFGPPGPPWVSDHFMQAIAERAERYDTGIQTHLGESFYEKLHGPRDYGTTTLAHLRDLAVLGPRFSIAHGVWLTDADIEILAETGTAVSHNPSSNLRLRAGIAPLARLLEAGATVALGMDGTSLNDNEDPFTEMRLALRLQRDPRLQVKVPEPAQVFAMATQGGAKLLRKTGWLGCLSEGSAADLVLLDLERLTWPWTAEECDPLELLTLRATAADVAAVLVGGKAVVQDGQPTGFDAAEAGGELARKLAAEAYPAEAGATVEALLPHLEAFYRSWDVPILSPRIPYNSLD